MFDFRDFISCSKLGSPSLREAAENIENKESSVITQVWSLKQLDKQLYLTQFKIVQVQKLIIQVQKLRISYLCNEKA